MSDAADLQTETNETSTPTQELNHAQDAVSAVEPDWSREQFVKQWDPGEKLIRAMRRYQHYKARTGVTARIVQKWYALKHHFWSAVAGADIPPTVSIGGGLLLPHPNGIVMHPDTRIGPNCLIFQ